MTEKTVKASGWICGTLLMQPLNGERKMLKGAVVKDGSNSSASSGIKNNEHFDEHFFAGKSEYCNWNRLFE
jgi:hypothetical protein